ncbi:MAG: GNAT family N-acetyltransferase [Sedimentisphaerales bacterium]|nr:GNAT family N-acetyltransferase [Sedimentisphaerales bacterium]
MLKIYPVETVKDFKVIKQLFTEYANYIFELFSPHSLPLAERLSRKALNEADNLPGEYAMPKGCILLAEYQGSIAGCVAVSEITENVCELKRLYVKPQCRRKGIGRNLAEAIINKAAQLKYKRMRLDTNKVLFIGAEPLYSSLGFVETGHIEGSPLQSSVHMELNLR